MWINVAEWAHASLFNETIKPTKRFQMLEFKAPSGIEPVACEAVDLYRCRLFGHVLRILCNMARRADPTHPWGPQPLHFPLVHPTPCGASSTITTGPRLP